MVAMRGGTTHVHHTHGAILKLKHSRTGLGVSRLPEARIFEGSTHGINLRNLAAQDPPHQVDVVNTQIQENTAGSFGIPERLLHGSLWIHTGGLHQIRRTDGSRLDLFLGIGVGLVIPAHKAQHEGQIRVALHSGLRLLALGHVHTQGLFGKHMLSCIQCGLDLPAMFRGGSHDHRRVNISLFQHLPVVRINLLHPQLPPGKFHAASMAGADSGQLRIWYFVSNIPGMDLAQAAQAHDTDT